MAHGAVPEAVLPLVKLLGIGLGFSLYHFQNMIVGGAHVWKLLCSGGYLVGRCGGFGLPKLQPAFEGSTATVFRLQGVLLRPLVVRSWLRTGSHLLHRPPDGRGDRGDSQEGVRAATHSHRDLWYNLSSGLKAARGAWKGLRGGTTGRGPRREASPGAEPSICPGPYWSRAPSLPLPWRLRRLKRRPNLPGAARLAACELARTRWRCFVGIILAIVAGSLTGVQSVPATLYGLEHPEMKATVVILPQCLGAWFASTSIYLLYSALARLRQKPVQHAVIRPAFASGCLWAVGFLFMIKGIHE